MKKIYFITILLFTLAPIYSQVNFTVSKTCLGDNTTFQLSTSIALDSVLWDFGINSLTNDTSTSSPIAQYNYPSAGTYNAKLYYFISGVIDSVSQVVTINPLPVVDLGGDQKVCKGSSFTLSTSQSFVSYFWSDSSTNSTYTVTSDGTYSVVATDANGCSNIDSATITFVGPTLNLSTPIQMCEGSSTSLDAGSGFASYQWSTGDITQTITVNESGNYSVTVYDNSGCSATDSIQVQVTDGPKFTGYEQTPVSTIADGFVVLYASGGTGDLQYSLLNTAPYQASNQFSRLKKGIYTATVIDQNGCTDSMQIQILTEKDPVEPSDGFSPNQDGVNETWTINKIEIYPKAIVRVYDRYGKQVFESKGNYKPWDGSYNNNFVPSGTYYYYIDLQNGNKPQVGYITIFR